MCHNLTCDIGMGIITYNLCFRLKNNIQMVHNAVSILKLPLDRTSKLEKLEQVALWRISCELTT